MPTKQSRLLWTPEHLLVRVIGDPALLDGAVSGVILMVATTDILAAVIGTFVLGLGDRVSQASPNANFAFEYTAGNNNVVEITHDGGSGVESPQIKVTIGGNDAWLGSDGGFTNTAYSFGGSEWSGKITAGNKLSIQGDGTNINDGDVVKVIWTASGSDKTAVIGESEVEF